jgi:hypothetical protein
VGTLALEGKVRNKEIDRKVEVWHDEEKKQLFKV